MSAKAKIMNRITFRVASDKKSDCGVFFVLAVANPTGEDSEFLSFVMKLSMLN